MNVEGFIIFDEKLTVQAYHKQIFDLFSIPVDDKPLQKIQRIVENSPDLIQRIKQLLTAGEKKTIDHFTLNINTIRRDPLKVTAFIVGETTGNRKILTCFCRNSEHSDSYTPGMRSMKYNAISKLAPSIAHEIRNPISSLAIHTEILDNSLPALSLQTEQFQRIKKSIAVLHSELERVTKIIDRFFKLVRSGAKESTYEDVNSILRETFELIKPQCYEQGIKIELNLERNIPFVYLNRDELTQVLLNIMIKAMESLPESGILTIISKKEENKSIIIIKDNGAGISPSDLEKIFTCDISSKDDGSGNSLLVSRQIIERIGGEITVQSGPHLGTSYTLELPKASKF
jgi:signal transduction histidine kinase